MKAKTSVPRAKDVYKVLELVPFEKVRVVILGQDPYYQVAGREPYATGIAFALNPRILKNKELRCLRGGKSLRSMLKAVHDELNETRNIDTSLESWAKQGVLLLNTALTTETGKSGAHVKAWRGFISALILSLNARQESLVFVLTCSAAKSFSPLIAPHHQIYLASRHPSRCWRIFEPSGRPVRFFLKIKNQFGIQWV